jgi:hypothetical protein
MKVTYLEICGFRAFGTSPQRLEFDSPLVVIHAGNSQGKTSLAESVEFLFTGATTRRLLLGGSPSEFEDALRNAHLSQRDPVYVEMELADATGSSIIVRRELESDYHRASDCVSRLTVNGAECRDISGAGLPLSDPPLAAPVLLEHTLRYAVSAKPGERSDYFKALLEIADLDIVRSEVTALIGERIAAPRHHLLTMLSQLAELPSFAAAVAPIRDTTDEKEIERALLEACHLAVPLPNKPPDATESLSDAAARLRSTLETRQLNVLPIAELSSAAPAAPHLGSDIPGQGQGREDSSFNSTMEEFSDIIWGYADRVAAVDTETAEVLPLLRIALQTGQVTGVDGSHPADCPVCLTPAAITAERVAAIRTEIADQQQLAAAATRLRHRLQEVTAWSQSVVSACRQAVPDARRWTDASRRARSDAACRLGAEQGHLERLLSDVGDLAVLEAKVGGTQADLATRLRDLTSQVECMRGLPEQQIVDTLEAVRALNSDAMTFATLHARVTVEAQAFIDTVRPALESGTDTAGWRTLLDLTSQVSSIAEALIHHSRRSNALNRLRQAAKDLEAASQCVLDQRLASMGGEVARWWDLLRPEELTAFGAITRKGTGKRYLDITAALAPQPATPGVVRNALAVFSNSQLNALGLSAFLARCTLLDTPIVLLDDPVPGSDREHRSTFASSVVGALLDDGRHVIVTTHDSELARHLHTSHQHLGVDEFEAVLSDPRGGTQVIRTGDDFERLMLDASSQMYSPLASNRRSAGNSLRIAAERLAKHVTVAGQRRAGNAAARVSDYDNKNLKELRPLAAQYAVRDNEVGQWQLLARILNEADHDTLDPPLPAELKNCHSTLRQLKRQHLEKDPNLMRS